MGDLLHLNFTNGILPLAVLVLVSIVLPAVLAGQTLSQRRLGAVMGLTFLVVWGVGAAMMAWLYAQINDGVVPGIWAAFERSAMMGLLWGPVLALVWLLRAQGVERRRGLLMGRDSA